MLNVLFNFVFLLVGSSQTTLDIQFHQWCDQVGIKTPHAKLITTSNSVAGRGVFAEGDVNEGTPVIIIPEYLVLHDYNAALNFPHVAKELEKKRSRYYKNLNKKALWRRFLLLVRRKKKFNNEEDSNNNNFLFATPDDFWQADLTAYSLAVLQTENHFWKPWISQWHRQDHMQAMYEKGISWNDDIAVDDGVTQLNNVLPYLSKNRLKAAVQLRLGRMKELHRLYEGFSSTSTTTYESKEDFAMYGILTSRAMEFGNRINAVMPMYDMINHSRQPNLGLHFNGEEFALVALRDISHGEEFFHCYKTLPDTWDEDIAAWILIQWGIPEQPIEMEEAVQISPVLEASVKK
uniref:SET domain-containing protein n=1 Tax=Ditylum brightwellii TaxID=49249 RepID=A0A7S2EC38_9STRA|mmetsp:Transcript_23299/g.34728  ORF Transcript_23299/g.34728 Transcript_23299/m.34728 type:complete len:348 (+) Transcript_23299:86-1129(+)